MENIFIFIIIMIISGMLSKKKKQGARQTETKVERTSHFDEGGNLVQVPKASPEQKLSDLLERIGMIEKETDEAVAATEEEIYQMQDEYTEHVYSEPKIDFESGPSSTDTIDTETSVNSSQKLRSLATSDDYAIKRSESRILKLFNTRSKLKRAVVISEIFNRKY